MNDVDHRIEHLEREVARLRRRNTAILVSAALIGIGLACKDNAAAPVETAPLTSLHFGDVTLDEGGLKIVNKQGTSVRVAAGSITIDRAEQNLRLDAEGLWSASAAGTAVLRGPHLSLQSAGYSVEVSADKNANVSVMSRTKSDKPVTTIAYLEANPDNAQVDADVKANDKHYSGQKILAAVPAEPAPKKK